MDSRQVTIHYRRCWTQSMGCLLYTSDTIEERPDYIVLDPPRDGIHPKALEKIINYGVDHMIYISCKPTSLARDLEVLLARGYVVDKVKCVNSRISTYPFCVVLPQSPHARYSETYPRTAPVSYTHLIRNPIPHPTPTSKSLGRKLGSGLWNAPPIPVIVSNTFCNVLSPACCPYSLSLIHS